MSRTAEPQPLTLTEAVIPVASLIVLVALSYFLFGDAGAAGPNQVALTFAVRAHFGGAGFLDRVPVRFTVSAPGEHHHVPLLVSPFAYSTYRGS